MSTFIWTGGGKSSKLGSGGKQQQIVAQQKLFFAKEQQKRGDGPGGFKPKRSLQVVAGSMDQFGLDDFETFASERGPRREAEESRSFVESGYSRQGGSFSDYSGANLPSAAFESENTTGLDHEGAFVADVGVEGGSIVSSGLWNFQQSGGDGRYNALGHEMGDFGDNEMMEEDDRTPRKSLAMSPQLRTTTRKRPRQSDVGGFATSSNEAGRGFRLDGPSWQAGNGYLHATKAAAAAAANGGIQCREMVRRDDDDDDDDEDQGMLLSGDHGSPFENRTMQDLKGFGQHHRHHQSIHAGRGSAKVRKTSGGTMSGTWQAHIVDDEDSDGMGSDSAGPVSSSRRRLSLSPGRHAAGGEAIGFASPESHLALGGPSAAANSAASLPIPSLSAGNHLFDDLFGIIGPDQAQKQHPIVAQSESGGGVGTLSKDRNETRACRDDLPSGRSMQPPPPGREWRAKQNLFGLDAASNMEDFEAIPNGRFSNNAIDIQRGIFSGEAKPVCEGINASKLTDVMMPSSNVVLDRSGLRASQGVSSTSDERAPKGLHNPLFKHAEEIASVRLQPREVSRIKEEHRNLSFSHAAQHSKAYSVDGRGGGRLLGSDTLEPLSEETNDMAVNESDVNEDIAQMVAARNHLLITREKRQTVHVREAAADAPKQVEMQLIRDESVPLASLVMPRVTTDASIQTEPELQQQQQQQQQMVHCETATGLVDGAMSNISPHGSDIGLVTERGAIHTNVVLPLFTLKGTAKFEKKVDEAAAGPTSRDENASKTCDATGGKIVVEMEVDTSPLAEPAEPNPGPNADEVKDEVDPDGVVPTTEAQAAVLDMGTDEGPASPATPAKVKKAEGAIEQGRGEAEPISTRDDDVTGLTAAEPASAATKSASSMSSSMMMRDSAEPCFYMTQQQREDVVERVLMGVIDSMACKVFDEKRKESEDVELLMSCVDEGKDRFEKRRPSTPRQPKRAHVADVEESTPPPGETTPRYSPFERPAFMEDALPTSPRDMSSPSPREQQAPAWKVQSEECLSPSL